MINEVLGPIRWNKEGLITVIAQDLSLIHI